MKGVTSRLLAILMVLLIGSPVCWCCLPSAMPVETAVRSCCQHKQQDSPQPGGGKDSCPCFHSVIQRDLAKNSVDLPATPVVTPVAVELVEHIFHGELTQNFRQTLWNDTGPPLARMPVYITQQSLLL